MHANFSSRISVQDRPDPCLPFHAPFQTPQNVGNVKVVENVLVDVTEPLNDTGIHPASSLFESRLVRQEFNLNLLERFDVALLIHISP